MKDKLRELFLSRSFIQKESDTSEYFGDFCDSYTNGDIYFRVISNRSIISVEVSKDYNDWYDLALVKALLHNEKLLNNKTSPEEYSRFLQVEYSKVAELFNNKNYIETANRLDELINKRIKQMFPKLK